MDNLKAISTILDWTALGMAPDIISRNLKRGYPLFEPTREAKPEPAAIVGFGASLKKTWEDIRNFKTVFTCSGAHKFLIERGVVPTYHVDSDPRPHKIKLLGEPHKDVTYLLASTCCSEYFDYLDKYKAKVVLWHMLFTEPEIYKQFPTNSVLLTGGDIVGPRAAKIATLLGYKNLHIFGMDGSGKHAAVHANEPPDWKYGGHVYKGKPYIVTDHMLVHIDVFLRDLGRMGIKPEFHGDGLLQAMAEDFEHVPDGNTYPLAVWKDD